MVTKFIGTIATQPMRPMTALDKDGTSWAIAPPARKTTVNNAALLRQGLLNRINGAYRMELIYEAQGLKFDALWWCLEKIKLRLLLIDLLDDFIETETPKKLAF